MRLIRVGNFHLGLRAAFFAMLFESAVRATEGIFATTCSRIPGFIRPLITGSAIFVRIGNQLLVALAVWAAGTVFATLLELPVRDS